MTELTVDLRGQRIETLDDFWDAVVGPCGLPVWFGRNLDAWLDTIEARADVIDGSEVLTVHVDRQGLFTGSCREAQVLAETFDGERNHLFIHPRQGAQGSRTASISASLRRASTSDAGPATFVAHRS